MVIIGGGIAGLTTAYELSRTEHARARWDVEVVEMGHRFGGRLASAHHPEAYGRNEEHGLHVWFGFYDNTFRLANEVWRSFDRPPGCPWESVWDGLRPIYHSDHGLPHRDGMGIRRLHHTRNSDRPGQAASRSWAAHLTTAADGLAALSHSVRGLVQDIEAISREPSSLVARTLFPSPSEDAVVRELDRLIAPLAARLARLSVPGSARGRVRLGFVVERLLRAAHEPLVDAARRAAGDDPAAVELCRAVDLALAAVRAMLSPEHGIMADGDLDRVSRFELKELLARHGARLDTLARCRLLEALYDMPFAFLGGDRRQGVLEASTALRFTLRLLGGYKHAVAYLLSAGAGETLVAPLYELLAARGVRFRPFHRLARLHVDERRRVADELVFVRGARVRAGEGAYDPLLTRDGLRGFRAAPDWGQLEDGEALRGRGVDFYSRFGDRGETDELSLREGRDFDDVVLALPLGCIKRDGDGHSPVAGWLDGYPRASACLERLHLVPTVAAQLWLKDEPRALGIEDHAVVTWAEPYTVACDMSPVIAHERWPAPAPRASVYLCGAWPLGAPAAPSSDRAAPARDLATAKAELARQLAAHGPPWFGGLESLYTPPGATDAWAAQYVRANVEPWDLADLSLPGADALRLEATDTGLDNLALAGSWVRTQVNTTCLEAAVSSGLAAARALGADTRPILGEAFMRHPSRHPVLAGRSSQGAPDARPRLPFHRRLALAALRRYRAARR